MFTLDADFVSNDKKTLPFIMASCRIYRAEYLYHRNSIEYKAESEFFDVVEEGCKIPEYVWQVDGDGALTVERVE